MVNVCAADPRVGELREELLRLVGVLEPAVHVPLRDGEVRLVDREDQVVLCPRNVLRPMFVLTVFLTVDSFFFANFERPVLGCIEANFYKEMLV